MWFHLNQEKCTLRFDEGLYELWGMIFCGA